MCKLEYLTATRRGIQPQIKADFRVFLNNNTRLSYSPKFACHTYFDILLSSSLENGFKSLKNWIVAHLSFTRSFATPISDDGFNCRMNFFHVHRSSASHLAVAVCVGANIVFLKTRAATI